MVKSQAMSYAVTMFVFGLIMPGIDNGAHLGGFIGGYFAGKWLDPLKPERMDHFLGAGLCLVATVLAILASLIITVPSLLRALSNS
jgi:rhomboid protease GluP